MNSKRNSMLAVMALALMVAAVAPSVASAQRVGGHFTLPCTTYWGSAVLPAGSYSFTMKRNFGGAAVLWIRGQKNATIALIADRDTYLKENVLEVSRGAGSEVVTGMKLADGGIKAKFHPTPVAKELLASASQSKPETFKIVLVADE